MWNWKLIDRRVTESILKGKMVVFCDNAFAFYSDQRDAYKTFVHKEGGEWIGEVIDALEGTDYVKVNMGGGFKAVIIKSKIREIY